MDEEIKNLEESYTSQESKRNSAIFGWAIGLFLFFLIVVGGGYGYYLYEQKYLAPTSSSSTSTGSQSETVTAINTSIDPLQTELSETEVITMPGEKGTIYITPMANYSVSAKVMSATNYNSDWQAEFEPTDLALAWGDLATPEFKEGITYTQSDRWYYYNYEADFKADSTYIIEHSSNHHIIPANDTIKNAVRRVKEGQKVKIDGYLVNVKYVMSKGEYTQNSSLSRADTGDGACEIIYVNKIQIDDKVYQ
jgi:hypothetical protein